MQRISLPWILTSATKLEGLTSIKSGQTLLENSYLLFEVVQMVDALYDQSVYRNHLRVSRQAAYSLRDAINAVIGVQNFQGERILSDYEVWNLHNQRDALRTVLTAELNALPTYLVTGTEPYDVDRLIANGPSLFPPDMLQKVPEAAADAAEVGKCLAFEVPTACGFHTFRIVEAVVRRYWDAVAAQKPRPRPDTIGNIAAQLDVQNIGDQKVREALKQLAKLHRNPLAHHDVVLQVEEAIGTVGMARSVITAMLHYLQPIPPTTLSPEVQIPDLYKDAPVP